ncbi:MAG TPA: hypothetical protein VK634_10090 [Reyranella sp.]|nr:hypothetical protein [Reyranella sp.]
MRAALIAKGLALVLPFLAAAQAAAEEEEENCRNFSWSVGRPIDLFDELLPVVRRRPAHAAARRRRRAAHEHRRGADLAVEWRW